MAVSILYSKTLNKRPRVRVIRSLGKPFHSVRNLFEGGRLITAPRVRNSNGSLPHEDGSDWHETLPKHVSDDLQFFIFRHGKFFPGNFFVQKIRGRFFFKVVRFWRSYEFLIRDGRCVVKSYCPKCPYFWGDFLVEGVKDSICVFYLDLGPKMTSTIWCWDEKFLASNFFLKKLQFLLKGQPLETFSNLSQIRHKIISDSASNLHSPSTRVSS